MRRPPRQSFSGSRSAGAGDRTAPSAGNNRGFSSNVGRRFDVPRIAFPAHDGSSGIAPKTRANAGRFGLGIGIAARGCDLAGGEQ